MRADIERDDRLVVEIELFALERPGELGAQLEAIERPLACMLGWNARTAFLPLAFATYIAVSALRSSSSAWIEPVLRATPIDAVSLSSRSSTTNPSFSASRIRAAIDLRLPVR